MAFENVQIHSTRNGSSGVDGYREDLASADVIVVSLTSAVGVTTRKWELVGRPEGSVAGGAGPEPINLGTATTASFTVDDDAPYPRDGSYIVRCTINAGSPSETRKQVLLARLTGLTISGSRHLRKVGANETIGDDTSVATISQGWATQINRLAQFAIENAGGGGGGGGTSAVVLPIVNSGEIATVTTAETVIWQGYVNFDTLQIGATVKYTLSGSGKVTAGTGHIKLRIDGTESTADGTTLIDITEISTTTTPFSGNSGSLSTPSGTHLLKVTLLPPASNSTIIQSTTLSIGKP